MSSSFLYGVLSYGIDFNKLEQEQVYTPKPKIKEAITEKSYWTESVKEGVRQLFIESALNGNSKEVDSYLSIMKTKAIDLTEEVLWIKRAAYDESVFSVKKFTQLSDTLKKQVYFVARAFGHKKVIEKLKPRMKIEPLSIPLNRSLFTIDMDIITLSTTIENFFKGLRKNGALLTRYEFDKLDTRSYMHKPDTRFERIQGKLFIERIVKQNNFKHIKVPKKIAVLDKYTDSSTREIDIAFTIDKDLTLCSDLSNRVRVYVEKIKPVQRKLSLEEAIEFMIVIEKTGYQELAHNYFIAKDGIYFIDTEIDAFATFRPAFEVIRTIHKLVHPEEDARRFLVEFDKREANFHKMKEEREEQEKEYQRAFADPLINFSRLYINQTFAFSLPI